MRSLILAAGFVLASISAASAGGATYLHAPMPILAPPSAPQGYQPAPVPNQDIVAPRKSAPKPGEPEFAASLTSGAPGVRNGQGYVPGSVFSEELQRKNRGGLADGLTPTIGFTVSVDNR
jgi:Rieske Fe-S protein